MDKPSDVVERTDQLINTNANKNILKRSAITRSDPTDELATNCSDHEIGRV